MSKAHKWTVKEMQSSLQIMDMLLEKYSHNPPQGVVPFNSTQDMARYFKQFTELMLPEEIQYKNKAVTEQVDGIVEGATMRTPQKRIDHSKVKASCEVQILTR